MKNNALISFRLGDRLCYNDFMKTTVTDIEERRKRRAEALALHAIEGITFSDEDIALAEELDRAGLSDDERIEAIKARYAKSTNVAAE